MKIGLKGQNGVGLEQRGRLSNGAIEAVDLSDPGRV